MTSAEWNTDADGPDKRELADELAERLRATYAAGGVVHRGQGKWYPGEPLPRWNIALQWRTDGVPLWRDPALFADPWDEATPTPDAAATRRGAGPPRSPQVLGLPDEQLRPAYEDPFAALADRRAPAGGRAARRADDADAGAGRQARRRRHDADRLGAAARRPARTGGPARRGGSAAAGWC